MGTCLIPKSKFYKKFCNKRQCNLNPCSQIIGQMKMSLEDVVIWKHNVQYRKREES